MTNTNKELDLGLWVSFKLRVAIPIMALILVGMIISKDAFIQSIGATILPLGLLLFVTGAVGKTWGIPKEYLETTKKKRKTQ